MLDLTETFMSSNPNICSVSYNLPRLSLDQIIDWWSTATVKEKTEFYRRLEEKGEARYVHDNLFHVYLDYDE